MKRDLAKKEVLYSTVRFVVHVLLLQACVDLKITNAEKVIQSCSVRYSAYCVMCMVYTQYTVQ